MCCEHVREPCSRGVMKTVQDRYVNVEDLDLVRLCKGRHAPHIWSTPYATGMVCVDHLLQSRADYRFVRLRCAPSTGPNHTKLAFPLTGGCVGFERVNDKNVMKGGERGRHRQQ